MEQELQAARDYVNKLVNSYSETTWRALLPDKNQSVVVAATLSLILSYLWIVSLTGNWLWTVTDQNSYGVTMFCSSYFWTNIKYCYVLPGQPMSCPSWFQGPTCLNWYSDYPGGTPSLIIGMQICGLIGTCTSLASTTMAFLTLVQVSDQLVFQKFMRWGAALSAISAVLALLTFVFFLYEPAITALTNGTGCIRTITDAGEVCIRTSDLTPPLAKSFGYSCTVTVFCFSVILTLVFLKGAEPVNVVESGKEE